MTTYEELNLALQVSVAIAAFISVYLVLKQLSAMSAQIEATQQASEAQSIISIVNFLQSAEAREAREAVRSDLSNSHHSAWTDAQNRHASAVCANYDVVAALLRASLIQNKHVIINNWAPSIQHCHQVLSPFVDSKRRALGGDPKYWSNFELAKGGVRSTQGLAIHSNRNCSAAVSSGVRAHSMQDGDIDYSRYTKRELDEALAGIDRERFPKNFAHLRSAYQALNTPLPGEPSYSRAATVKGEEPWRPKYDEKGRYVPNQIPGGDRLSYGIFSLLLFAFASYGLWVNDIYLPGRWTRGVHLHDVPADIMYGAMSCACLVMVSVVVDHYDRRDNERYYRSFAEAGRLLGWTLFILSLAWSLFDRAA